jgi:hypothetical protein
MVAKGCSTADRRSLIVATVARSFILVRASSNMCRDTRRTVDEVQRCFRESSRPNSSSFCSRASSSSAARSRTSHRRNDSIVSSGSSSPRTGSSTPSRRSAEPNTFSSTWPATRTASPSPTIAWSASRMTASPSDGRITPLGASRRS